MKLHHIVNISGGKDSQAVALLAADSGRKFDLWMADTGNEHPATVEHANYLAEYLGKPLNIARADFTAEITRKRDFVSVKWREQGVDEAIVLRALSVLEPTGNPFLDLCVWKGRFPSRMAQFCTEFLKQKAMEDACIGPLLNQYPVAQWIGVRRDESLKRRNAPMFQRVKRLDKPHAVLMYRPIIHWSANDVFSFSKARGVKPNPLYLKGFGRVGCFPCINANKNELSKIGRNFPLVVERLMEWESVVAAASKRGKATFFASGATPEGAALGAASRDLADTTGLIFPDAATVFDWAKTTRGGKQYDLFGFNDDGLSCSSQYGLCE